MTAAEHETNDLSLSPSTVEPLTEEWLTDVIDQLKRDAFRLALERRRAEPPYRSYRTVVEEAFVVRTKSQ